MTLPAFAAERRAEALLLLNAGAAVDRYKFPPARWCCGRMTGQTDVWKDGHLTVS